MLRQPWTVIVSLVKPKGATPEEGRFRSLIALFVVAFLAIVSNIALAAFERYIGIDYSGAKCIGTEVKNADTKIR